MATFGKSWSMEGLGVMQLRHLRALSLLWGVPHLTQYHATFCVPCREPGPPQRPPPPKAMPRVHAS
eukprot:124400-Alexandrium_andersonii.AAC.1